MKVLYDDEVDALYVPIQPEFYVHITKEVDEARTVDLDEKDRVVGIEVMGASQRVRLTDLIEPFGLEQFKEAFEQIEQHPFRSRENP